MPVNYLPLYGTYHPKTMKKIIFLPFFFLFAAITYGQFDKWFEHKTLRLDYYHSGNHKEESCSFDELIEEPYWGGSLTNLIDTFGYGNYFMKVYEASGRKLLYSRGYSTLFFEWQTTKEADTVTRSFSESVVFPYPKVPVDVEISKRTWEGRWKKIFSYHVDTGNYFIKKDMRMEYPVYDVWTSGDPAEKVDVVILPDGYTEEEMDRFVADCRQFEKNFFTYSPYKESRMKFNLRAVLAPSPGSGTDIPAEDVWVPTILNTSYYTFDSERYLMTYDYKRVRDLAANAPYDQIYILVNSDKYGGGAIYNFYNVAVNGNMKSAKILIHEFGHGFAGLGDEYGPDETYGEFYNTKVEPWEPNLTTLVHFERKWKDMVADTVPVPTPDIEKYYHVVGVFEGGGYMNKGMYRPMHDCLMNTFNGDVFCPVCRRAILRMIDFYTR